MNQMSSMSDVLYYSSCIDAMHRAVLPARAHSTSLPVMLPWFWHPLLWCWIRALFSMGHNALRSRLW